MVSSPSHQSHLPPNAPHFADIKPCWSYQVVLGNFTEEVHSGPAPGLREWEGALCVREGRVLSQVHPEHGLRMFTCLSDSTRPSNLLDPLWGMFPLSLSIFLMNITVLSSLSLPHHCLQAEAEQPEPIFCMALARQDTSLRFGIFSFKMEKACSSYKIIVAIIR